MTVRRQQATDIVRLAAEWIAAYNTLDARRVADLYADDCACEDVTLGHISRGRDGVRAYAEWITSRLEAVEMIANRTIVSGNSLALEWLSHGNGGAASGGTTIRGVTLFEAENGHFTRSTEYWDARAMMRNRGPNAIETMASELARALRSSP